MTLRLRSRSGTLLAATAPPPATRDHATVARALAAVLDRRAAAERQLAGEATVVGRLADVFALEDRRTAWLVALHQADVPILDRLSAARALATSHRPAAAAPAPDRALSSEVTAPAAAPPRKSAER